MRRKDSTEVLFEIKYEIPGFNKEELFEYIKWSIPELYKSLKDGEKIKIRCKPELLEKLNKEKIKYRINKDMDHISVQMVDLFGSTKKNDEIHIQLYLSVHFYDKVKNNIYNHHEKDKYWNDIWIVTIIETLKSTRKHSNCVNCNALMEYNKIKDIYECKYCGNIMDNKSDSKWKIVDIELGNHLI